MNEIREKEKKLSRDKINTSSKFGNEMCDFFPALAKFLKCYYQMRKVKNMFLVKVVEYVQKNYGQIKSQEEILVGIKTLAECGSAWISLIPNHDGLILRMDTAVELEHVIFALNR